MAPTVAGDEGDREERCLRRRVTRSSSPRAKTEERLQEAPLAVAVVTADGIDRLGFNSVTDLKRGDRRPCLRREFSARDANRPVIRGPGQHPRRFGPSPFFYRRDLIFNGSIADSTSIRLRASKWSRGRRARSTAATPIPANQHHHQIARRPLERAGAG